ncbi:hypothetical protein GS982_01855 [Rhodococcus hoagii]|uniref:DUF7448 domain-containing protein n=1 Tax=Rhodococcus hoagii TaxID=43767 RepID=A0A9Q5EYM1_RHOHA|nr:hypothetical protein [Prescottella equi]NKT77342.1 hypothetical protein [Prescottella equi]NKZ81127.1 hypothetical protein [Prescottella equi]
MPYPPDILDEDDDDGTMPENVAELSEAVIGHRIVSAEKGEIRNGGGCWGSSTGFILTLDNGTRVQLADTSDCCAFTELESFLLHPERVEHIITGVATTDGYTRWHIFADLGDILELQVGWSSGNPFYYGYGFDINVIVEERAELEASA